MNDATAVGELIFKQKLDNNTAIVAFLPPHISEKALDSDFESMKKIVDNLHPKLHSQKTVTYYEWAYLWGMSARACCYLRQRPNKFVELQIEYIRRSYDDSHGYFETKEFHDIMTATDFDITQKIDKLLSELAGNEAQEFNENPIEYFAYLMARLAGSFFNSRGYDISWTDIYEELKMFAREDEGLEKYARVGY